MANLKEKLIQYFTDGEKPSGKRNIGAEIEHFIIRTDTCEPVRYGGEKGVRTVLEKLMRLYPNAEATVGEDLLGFTTDEFAITLEPAAQLEISIAKTEHIGYVESVYSGFRQKLGRILTELGYAALNTGCRPVGNVREIPLIPKERYRLMDKHFSETGTGGIEMMRGTCSLQVSVDYFSEEDFRRKIQAAYFYTPLFKLLCDNSAHFSDKPLIACLKRTDIWNRTDNTRCGVPPDIFADNYGFSDYAEFLCNMPPIFVIKDGENVPTGNMTAGEIFTGTEPAKEDIEHIISMAFPDVRLKRYIEIRGADSVPQKYMLAYCALIKGLIYSEEALDHAQYHIRSNRMNEMTVRRTESELMQNGWDGCIYDEPARIFAETVINMAGNSLSADERRYLSAFEDVIKYGGITKIPETEA